MKIKVKLKPFHNFKLIENKIKLKCPWPMAAIVSRQTVQKWLWMKEGGLLTRLSELQHCKIISYFHNDVWKEDLQLKEDLQNLQKYVGQLFKREEILSFVIREYSCYTWSVRSFDRMLRHFGIFYCDRNVTVDDVRQAVAEEMDRPGKLLGYRAMQKKVRQEHELNWNWSTLPCMTNLVPRVSHLTA